MAKHSADMKRIPIKHVRDKAKARYNKGTSCEICAVTEPLDFHHYYTLTPLFEKWCRTNKVSVATDEEVIAIRDQFIAEHEKELYQDTVTLCHSHHMKLHSVYGKDPTLATAEKQKNWVRIQKEKLDEARKLAN
jgi:hypothetical protein